MATPLGLRVNLNILGTGQSFRWRKTSSDLQEWTGVARGRVWRLLNDSSFNVHYEVLSSSPHVKGSAHDILLDYFNSEVDLEDVYAGFLKADSTLSSLMDRMPHMRVLRQDPFECLLSFICSTNNHIPRISSMVEKLCLKYGEDLPGSEYKDFPTLESLSQRDLRKELRELGFGYRAEYISATVKDLATRNPEWLEELRMRPYLQAHEALQELKGVGAKVSDCVCLMALDKHEAFPIDTHVWQVTGKRYWPKVKTLSPKVYKEIGAFYREKFGLYAGWAQNLLFVQDLQGVKRKR